MNSFDFDLLQFDVKLAQLERATKQLSTMLDVRGITRKPVDVAYLIDVEAEDNQEVQDHFRPNVEECMRCSIPF